MATSKRGFASMDPEKRRMISRKGGQAAHAKGAAHEFTPEEARVAGRKGGQAVSRDRLHMARIGRRGGLKTPRYSQAAARSQGATSPPVSHTGGRATAENATTLLRADHRRVEGLFRDFAMANGQPHRKQAVATQVCAALQSHSEMAEEIFYPAVRAAAAQEVEPLVSESLRAHRSMADLSHQLATLSPEDPVYDLTFEALTTCVRHHVREEEEHLFPLAERTLGDELGRLG